MLFIPFSPTVRDAIFLRDGHRCQRCGSNDYLQAHHLLPSALGGTDTVDNGITFCRTCHPTFFKKLPQVDSKRGFFTSRLDRNRLYLKSEILNDLDADIVELMSYKHLIIIFQKNLDYDYIIKMFELAIRTIKLKQRRSTNAIPPSKHRRENIAAP